jgi:hypothetical protein
MPTQSLFITIVRNTMMQKLRNPIDKDLQKRAAGQGNKTILCYNYVKLNVTQGW